MIKLILANLASPANPGDQAIFLSTLQLLRSFFKNPAITVTTRDFSERHAYEELGCRVIRDYPDTEVLATDSLFQTIVNLPRAFSDPSPLRDAIAEADFVFLAGGGYLCSYRRFLPGLSFLAHLTPIDWARKLKKPVIILPHSYGPLRSRAALLLFDRAIQKVDLAFYREEISGKWLKERYPVLASRFVFMPDLALALESAGLTQRPPAPKRSQGLIGVTVRPWADGKVDAKNYFDVLATTLSEMHFETGAGIRIIPQVQDVKKMEGDTGPSQYLFERLKFLIGRDAVEVCDKDPYFRLHEICRLYQECDLMVAMRLHSSLLSFLMGCPAVVVGYQHKAEGILKSLHLSDLYAGRYDEVTVPKLKAACQKVWGDRAAWREKIAGALASSRSQIFEIFFEEMKQRWGEP